MAFGISPAYFDEIAYGAVGATRFSFAIPALPAAAGLMPLATRIATLNKSDVLAIEEMVVRLAFAATTVASGKTPSKIGISAGDEKRITRAMRYIEAHSSESINIDRLATIASLSKFHFLRVFARIAGVSPYRYLINTRFGEREIFRCHNRRREEVETERISAVLLHDHHGIWIVVEFLRHLLPVLRKNDAVHDDVLERILREQPTCKHMEVIEPGTSLIKTFCDELCREDRVKFRFPFKWIVAASVRH